MTYLLFVPTIWSTPIVVLGSNRPIPRKSLLMGSKLQWTTLVSKKAPSNWFVQISLTKWGEIRWVSSRAKSFFCWWNLTSEKVGDWIYIFLKSNFTTTSCKWYIYIYRYVPCQVNPADHPCCNRVDPGIKFIYNTQGADFCKNYFLWNLPVRLRLRVCHGACFILRFCSTQSLLVDYLPKTNMTLDNPAFEDVVPIEHGDVPMSC